MALRLGTDQEAREILVNSFSLEGYQNLILTFYPRVPELEDADDALHEVKENLNRLLDSLTPITIEPDNVQDICFETMEELVKKIESLEKKAADTFYWKSFVNGFGIGFGGATAGVLALVLALK